MKSTPSGQRMVVHVPVVCGVWIEQNKSWHFEVDTSQGGRMFTLRDGCTLGELLQMAEDDFTIVDKKVHTVQLSYPLPDVMLKQMASDTPPTYLTNDRHVESLIQMSKEHVLRLCVTIRSSDNVNVDVDGPGEDFHNDYVEDTCALDEDAKAEDHNGVPCDVNDGEGGAADGVDEELKDESDALDVDYSEYGKVDDEDADEDEDDEDVVDDDNISLDAVGRRVRGLLNGTWSDNIYVMRSFPSKEKLISELHLTAVMLKFAFRAYKSTKSLYVAKCHVNGCAWKVRAAVKNEPNTFWVTKYVKTHTCSVSDRAAIRRLSTPKYIGRLFIERVGIIDGIVPSHIKDSMKKMFGMNLDYTTSYRALMYAQVLVRGTSEDGYENLPSYLHEIEKANPGSVTDLVHDDMNRFKYLFVSFGASISGFRYLRRVIVVDGTHLSGRYGGVLLVAAGQDGNFQIFPLAFGIVDSECDASWEWFFTKLRSCFSDEFSLVIVSDRHSSIAKACTTVLPWATRGICYYHLQQNIVTYFRGKNLMYLVKGAAYAHTVADYNRYMDALRRVNPSLAEYMENADPRLWSRVHFPGDRYNIKTSNIAESINSALKKARGFPISFLLEFIREKVSRWHFKRREDALSLTTRHSRGVEYLLSIRQHYADKMTVERIDAWRFFVRGGTRDCMVNLEAKKCDCGVFDVEKIPCSHVIAAATEARVHLDTLVCPTYRTQHLYATYSGNILPPSASNAEAGTFPTLIPPIVKRPPGRQKKSRWQSWLEMSRKKGTKTRKLHKHYSCSKCRQTGHTRPHCRS